MTSSGRTTRRREPPAIRIDGSLAFIPLTKGYTAVVDASDVPIVAGSIWHAVEEKRAGGSLYTVYARRCRRDGHALMHRLLLDAPRGALVDHLNGDGLDNRRSTNLRTATSVENSTNKTAPRRKTAGPVGAYPLKSGRWKAAITVGGQYRHLGYFSSVEEASAAYEEAATSRGVVRRSA